MTRRYWTADEVARLRELYPNLQTKEVAARLGVGYQRVVSKAYTLGLHKSAQFLLGPLAHRLDGVIGTRTRFSRGHAPWNKGIKGIDVGGRETRFQPGWTPPNVQDVGALRITSDGVLQIKLAPGPRQWVMMSRYTWWLHTGKWPRRGYLLRARNGDPHDTRFENLEHISKRENMLRNTIHNYPPELARLVQLRGVLTRQINRREKAA